LASLAPLVLAGMVVWGLWREPGKEEEGQILIEELTETLQSNRQDQFPLLCDTPAATRSSGIEDVDEKRFD